MEHRPTVALALNTQGHPSKFTKAHLREVLMARMSMTKISVVMFIMMQC